MEHFCKNHPDRPTRKKCHHCQEYICVECQSYFLQRPFCSLKCLLLSVLGSTWALIKSPKKKKRTTRAQKIKRLQIRPVQFLGYLFLLVLLLLLWRSVTNMTQEIRLMRLAQKALPPTVKPEEAGEAEFALEERPDAMVLSNKITIHGEAADDIVLSLKVNGELVAATVPEKNRFVFEDVELKYGSNEIVVLGMDASGKLMVLEKMTTFFGSPRLNYLARDFTRGDVTKSKIALTFDGGAGNGSTQKILDYLKDKNVRCTMFLTGGFIKRYPALTRRIVEDGHEVGNHTWSHPHLTTFAMNRRHNTLPDISRERLHEELRKTADLFLKTTGRRMVPYWRAPFGEHNLQIRRWAAELGYRQVGWTFGHGNGENMDTLDWVVDSTAAGYMTSQQILQKILDFGKDDPSGANGSIILMHLDTQRRNDPVYEIIPTLIDSLRERGYKLVTVSELMR